MMILLATLSIVIGAAAPDGNSVREAAKAIYAGDDYQDALPKLKEPKNATSEAEKRQRAEEMLRRQRDRERQRQGESSFGGVANMLLWALMIAVAAILVVYMGRDFFGYAPEGVLVEAEANGERAPPDKRVIDRPLGDASALASQGKYQEAIHTLLLQTLVELSRKLPEPLAPSLTSREVLSALRLSADQHGALTGLITAVEITHFGAHTPTQADYERCLGHFQSFARAYLRGAV